MSDDVCKNTSASSIFSSLLLVFFSSLFSSSFRIDIILGTSTMKMMMRPTTEQIDVLPQLDAYFPLRLSQGQHDEVVSSFLIDVMK